jgi:hypothetical protein
MDFVYKIILENAGANTSNGEYTRDSGENTWFYSENGNHIEPTVEGWYLVDTTLKEQTYMFNHDFKSIYAVGDCIYPLPNFLVFKN